MAEEAEGSAVPPGLLEHLALLGSLTLARSCLREMDDRGREKMFLWCSIMRFSAAEIRTSGLTNRTAMSNNSNIAPWPFIKLWIARGRRPPGADDSKRGGGRG
jgi:hypothetical protein